MFYSGLSLVPHWINWIQLPIKCRRTSKFFQHRAVIGAPLERLDTISNKVPMGIQCSPISDSHWQPFGLIKYYLSAHRLPMFPIVALSLAFDAMALLKNDASRSAPMKDVCSSFAAIFYSKQQYIVCLAGSSRKFHWKCLEVGLEECYAFMETGTSSFKCADCT